MVSSSFDWLTKLDCFFFFLKKKMKSGFVNVVEFLIKKGAIVDQPKNSGSTPLCVASYVYFDINFFLLLFLLNLLKSKLTKKWYSQQGHIDVVVCLLENGAKVNSTLTKTGATSLWTASRVLKLNTNSKKNHFRSVSQSQHRLFCCFFSWAIWILSKFWLKKVPKSISRT